MQFVRYTAFYSELDPFLKEQRGQTKEALKVFFPRDRFLKRCRESSALQEGHFVPFKLDKSFAILMLSSSSEESLKV